MEIPTPKVGLVISYAYVWRQDYVAGQREGVKDRPCVIVLAIADDGQGRQIVTVAPITHLPPSDPAGAVEVWPRTKERLGLDGERSWAILDDLNVFTWPGYDLRPVPGRPGSCVYGLLPAGFMRGLQQAFVARFRYLRRSDRDA
ncbi:growth inhibitor PemK [Zavarzinia compransoris]|uniref:Growth inhibitor PemK n=1 Tax=Zavarzinia compransoris TaxID=1264899 RepID=A0A317E5A3_9PROT|nr:growth inhibitor PemK [Zavarzinia compransoris]PWR21851.1 growth inhibitor PemK [Zavarzinia compransoris]TDP45345.1 hypothetical protein DES42_10546 [Zavarzinia compransoris]